MQTEYAGKISVDELNDAMTAATSNGGQFAGGMEAASKTTKGLISTLKDNVNSLIGEVFEPLSQSLLGNILPTAIDGIAKLTDTFHEKGLEGMISAAGDMVGGLVDAIVQQATKLIKGGVSIVQSILDGIEKNLPSITDGALKIINTLIDGFIKMLPQILQMGLQVVLQLANGIAKNLPEIIPQIIDIIIQITDTLIDNIDMLVDAAIAIVTALAEGLMDALPVLIDKAPVLIDKLVTAIVDNLPKLLEAGWKLAIQIGVGLIKALPDILCDVIQLCGSIIDGILKFIPNMFNAGKSIFGALWDGLKSIWNDISTWIDNKVSWILDKLDIWNNSKSQMTMGGGQTSGGGAGRKHRTGLDYVPYDGYKAVLHKGEMILTQGEAKLYKNGTTAAVSNSNVTVNNYSPKSIDAAESARLYKQSQRELALGM